MIDPFSIASSAMAFFVVAISPGPATISNATIAMSYGRKASLVYATGLSTGLLFWGLIAATGMGAVLQGSLYLLMSLKVLGGTYLLWLAVQAARSAWHPNSESKNPSVDKRWFLRGMLLNMSNPKSVIAWMAALSVGLSPDAGNGAVIAATCACVVVGYFANALYSVLFSINGMMMGYQRLRRKIQATVALLFTLAGMGMIKSALSD